MGKGKEFRIAHSSRLFLLPSPAKRERARVRVIYGAIPLVTERPSTRAQRKSDGRRGKGMVALARSTAWWRQVSRPTSNRPYIVDFCCVERGLIVELDGGQRAKRNVEDERRTRLLERFGYRVLRFWDNDIIHNLEGVVERINQVLENPHPSLSHRNGRG